MNLPNSLTLFRILVVPGFLIAIIYRQWVLALGLFLAAAVSDFLDGFLARKLEQKTVLGSYLDPLADKLLIAVSFLALAIQQLLPPWLCVIVLTRDLFICLGAGIIHLLQLDLALVVTRWGKTTTALQMLYIVLCLVFAESGSSRVLLWSGALTACFTLISGGSYFLAGLRTLPRELRGSKSR
jgi:cardiolipin synthase (CMP-forming)